VNGALHLYQAVLRGEVEGGAPTIAKPRPRKKINGSPLVSKGAAEIRKGECEEAETQKPRCSLIGGVKTDAKQRKERGRESRNSRGSAKHTLEEPEKTPGEERSPRIKSPRLGVGTEGT